MTTSDEQTRRFRVSRFKRGERHEAHVDVFDVPVTPRMTVLDALPLRRRRGGRAAHT
jgi:succinate dehydrogenase/fumarate reductase-like Fe-S protein